MLPVDNVFQCTPQKVVTRSQIGWISSPIHSYASKFEIIQCSYSIPEVLIKKAKHLFLYNVVKPHLAWTSRYLVYFPVMNAVVSLHTNKDFQNMKISSFIYSWIHLSVNECNQHQILHHQLLWESVLQSQPLSQSSCEYNFRFYIETSIVCFSIFLNTETLQINLWCNSSDTILWISVNNSRNFGHISRSDYSLPSSNVSHLIVIRAASSFEFGKELVNDFCIGFFWNIKLFLEATPCCRTEF